VPVKFGTNSTQLLSLDVCRKAVDVKFYYWSRYLYVNIDFV